MPEKKRSSLPPEEDGTQDVRFSGSAVKRLFAMMLPHKKALLLCTLLLMVITVLDLYRPILIGDAIDRYITGPYGPGEEAEARFLGVARAGAVYIAILVALFFITRIQRLTLQKTGQRIIYDLRNLVFDEATSNIDTETELWIREALERLMRGRTTIMVAHRLSTVQNADRIIVIHHGQIRESGTHQELLEKNGIYKKLYLLQASAE